VPVTLKRFLDPEWVFILGIDISLGLARFGGVLLRLGRVCRDGFCRGRHSDLIGLFGRVVRVGAGLRGGPLGVRLGLRLGLVLQRSDDHDHVAAIDRGCRFDGAELGHVFGEALKEAHTLVGTRLFAASEEDHGLHLVARLEESLGALALRLVVVHVDLQTESNLFEDRVRLVATRFLRLLRSFVLELAVIHDLGNGRLAIGGHLNQIEVCLLGKLEGDVDTDDADLLTGRSDEANLGNPDTVVGTGIADALLLLSLVRHARTCSSGYRARQRDRR
jgi:hypothetical protein